MPKCPPIQKKKNDSMVKSYNEEHEAAVEHAQWQGWHDCSVTYKESLVVYYI